MIKKAMFGIIAVIIGILVIGGIVSYFVLFRDNTEISSEDEEDFLELSEENGELEDIEGETYYEIINNIGNYRGEELIFEKVELTTERSGSFLPYAIKANNNDGTFVTLRIGGNLIPPYAQEDRKWNFIGIVEKDGRGYYLNVTKLNVI